MIIKKGIIILTSCCFLLSGCWNAREVENIYYAHSLGYDYIKGNYVVYLYIISFALIAKQEAAGGTQGMPKGVLVKGVGPSVVAAHHDLYRTTPQSIYWGHVRSLTFSERILKHGISDVIDFIERYNETRYSSWIFATRDNVVDVLKIVPPIGSALISKMSTPNEMHKQRSFLNVPRLHELIALDNEKPVTTWIPNLKVSKEKWYSDSKKIYQLQLSGISVIKNRKLIGQLKNEEVQGLRWMNPKSKRIALYIEKDNINLATLILSGPKINMHHQYSKGRNQFTIDVSIHGDLIELSRHSELEELEQLAAKTIKNEIIQTFEAGKKQNTDLLNLADYIYRKQNHVWKDMNKNHVHPIDTIDLKQVNVKVEIKNTGRKKFKT